MKGRFDTATGRCLLLTAIALAVVAGSSQAQIVSLTDANSVVQVNTASQAGMFNWSVDGIHQLNQQWFWYRIGAGGPQSSIDTLSAPVNVHPNPATLFATYNNGTLGVEADFTLTGGTAGSGMSAMGESITLTNSGASSLDLHFFQYADFDLRGAPGGDTVQLFKNLGGHYYEALQTKDSVSVSETDVVPGATRGEANLFNSTLTSLNGTPGYALNNNAGPVGPGNVTWALEWDITLASGGTYLISKNLSVVPEPTVLALVSLGLVAFGLRRRSRPAA